MNARFVLPLFALLVLPVCAWAQETPGKPDVWKSAGTRKATPAEIQALVDTPGPAIINRNPCRAKPLLWGTESPADVAAAHLVEVGEPAIKPVLPLLHDNEMWRRRLAVEILGRIGNRRVTPALLALLPTEKDENVRAALASSLSMLRDSRAERALIRLAQDGAYSTYGASVQGLARLHSSRAIHALTSLLPLPADSNAPDYNTHLWQANMAADALAEAGPKAFPALLRFITDRKTPPSGIAQAIPPAVAVGDKRMVPILLRLLDSPDDGVRNAAVTHLTKWPDARIFPALVRVLHGVKGNAQMSAGIVLATMGTPEALEVLAQAADDADVDLRHAASNACRYLTTPAAAPMLLHLLKEGRADTPTYAAYALGKLKERSAIPALCAALAGSNVDLRAAAAAALGNFNDAEAIGGLLGALDDTSKDVRLISVRLLRDKHDSRIVPAFQRLTADADKQVQDEADFGIRWQETAVRHTAR